MDRILLSQNPPNAPPSYVPDGEPIYPVFNVTLQSPLPPPDTFISSMFSFLSAPLFTILSIFVSIQILKLIVNAFNKK